MTGLIADICLLTASSRRPIEARGAGWAKAVARRLKRMGMRPNQVSALSVVFAALAGVCLLLAPGRSVAWGIALAVAAALCIQLRLLCNLFDGMLAVEGGMKSRSGEIFNDFPDRLSDSVILVAAGYSISWVAWGSALGWAVALLAMLTAYVRVLGGAAGARQYFTGPMAKQHRMAVMIAACLASAVELATGWGGYALTSALAVIGLGCVVTIVRRICFIVRELESAGSSKL